MFTCYHGFIADDEGFEPPEPFGSLVFKTSSIDHSDNHPVRSTSSMISHEFNSCKSSVSRFIIIVPAEHVFYYITWTHVVKFEYGFQSFFQPCRWQMFSDCMFSCSHAVIRRLMISIRNLPEPNDVSWCAYWLCYHWMQCNQCHPISCSPCVQASIFDRVPSVLIPCMHGIRRNMESTRISNLTVILCVSWGMYRKQGFPRFRLK